MKLRIILVFFAFLLPGSCGKTSLASVKADPAAYNGITIQVSATVIHKISVPLVPVSVYEIYDGSEKIYLFSTDDYTENEKYKFSGDVFYFGGEDLVNGSENFTDSIFELLKKTDLNNVDRKKAEKITDSILVVLSSVIGDVDFLLFLIEK